MDGSQGAQGRRRIINRRADMGFDAQGHAVMRRAISQFAERFDGLLERGVIVALAARAAVDEWTANRDCRLECRFHRRRILGGLLHRQNRQVVFAGQFLDGWRAFLPAFQDQMLAHAANGGNLNAIVAGHRGVFEGGLHVVAAEQN